MSASTHKTSTVGLVITLSLILGAVGILSVGGEQGFFRDRVDFTTDFPNVDGLTVGAPVRLIGVNVGVITAIGLPPDISKQEVDVTFAVDRVHTDRIRQGTTATLRNLTYVSNEKYVELKPGDPTRPVLPAGAYVESPTSEVEQLIAQSQSIAGNIVEISTMFRELLNTLNSGESVLSRLITDPEFAQEALENTKGTIAHINSIVAKLEAGEGTLGRLMVDDEYAEATLTRISSLLDRMDAVTGRLESGQGLLGQLLAEESDLEASVAEFRGVAASLQEILGKIESGQGLVGRLVSDDEFGRTATARLDALMADLEEITRKIDEGEGTLGLLLNEPELYDQATEVVGGVSDSRFLMWVAKRVRNKEIKQKIKAYAEELEQAEQAAP